MATDGKFAEEEARSESRNGEAVHCPNERADCGAGAVAPTRSSTFVGTLSAFSRCPVRRSIRRARATLGTTIGAVSSPGHAASVAIAL